MKKLLKSFSFAIKGIQISLRQRNFRIQIAAGITALCMGSFFNITGMEWCIVLLCISLVLSLEMSNTALEHLVDFVHPQYHKTAEIIKDVAAGAVLLSSIISSVIGMIIFGKYFLALLHN
jgi:diacylglycerol kinase